jgi:hypothetical protein
MNNETCVEIVLFLRENRSWSYQKPVEKYQEDFSVPLFFGSSFKSLF